MSKYYTPKHIIDYIHGVNPSAGSGSFLLRALRWLRWSIISNPPYKR